MPQSTDQPLDGQLVLHLRDGRTVGAPPEPWVSPFEGIKHQREDGTEYWSARQLQELMGYEKWDKFLRVVRKAAEGLEATGGVSHSHFSPIREKSKTDMHPGLPAREDYELTRLACYLTALAGDESKPAVAAAKQYFAIKTREAEVAPQLKRELTRRELLVMALEAEDRADALSGQLGEMTGYAKELEPRAQAHDELMAADGTFSIGQVAQMLGTGQTRFFQYLRMRKVLRSTAGDSFNLPYQQHIDTGRFTIKAGTRDSRSEGSKATWTTRVTPKGLEYLRKLWAERVEVERGVPGIGS